MASPRGVDRPGDANPTMKICLECEGISDTPREICASCGFRLADTSAVHFPLRRGEADAANPLLGSVIDSKYRVQGVLGKGGMGTVFRAVHQVSLIPVALKILNPRFSVRDEYRGYFLEEARKAGRVTHEHAGRILDVGEAEDGTVYIAMEEVHGITLHECIHGDECLPPAIVVDILEQICQALAAAHHAGLVHRDLSPRNVMVVIRNGTPFVKILDFGIAKGLPHASPLDVHDPKLPMAPAGFASPPYSAPEHLEGKDVDARADLYSLGVIAFEALTQDLPVDGDTPQELAEATLRGEVDPLPAITGVPTRLVKLIRALMSIDPNDRPNSAEEVRVALQSIRQPDSRLLRDVAVLLLLAAVVVCAFAYSRIDDPVLAKRFGRLVVGPSAEEVPAVQYLRTRELAVMQFDYAGFAASDLVAEVARGGERLSVDELGAQVEDGHLVLDRGKSRVYDNFLADLERRCQDGAVMITFQLSGGAALGVANVLVDDTVPVLEFKHHGSAGVINAKSEFEIGCRDHGGLATVALACRTGDVELGPVSLDPMMFADSTKKARAADLLRSIQVGAEPVGDVSLTLVATDRAGNTARRRLDGEFGIDFALPSVLGRKQVSAMFVDARQASLSFEFDEPDVGLQVGVRDSAGAEAPFVDLHADPVVDNQITVYVPRREGSANLEFQLRDRAGNSSTFTRMVTFYNLDAAFQILNAPEKVLRPLAAGIVWTGEAIEFGFACNRFYKPVDVTCSDRTLVATLLSADFGKGRIRLPRLLGVDKNVRLEIELEPDTVNPTPKLETWNLRIQSRSLSLRLLDTSGMRFLHQLASDDGLFRDVEAGVVAQRANWRLTPADSRMLRGEVGWGSTDADTPEGFALPACRKPQDPFFRSQRLRRGRNVLYLLLRDVFGRDVEISIGGGPAPRLSSGPMRGAARIADFQYQGEVAQVQADPLKLEYQQRTRVIFHSDYTFDASDKNAISLLFQAHPVPCVELRPRGDGTDLVFDLAYGDIARASGEGPNAEVLKRAGHTFDIPFLRLRTPAGDQEWSHSIHVVTTRSSLVLVRLGERIAGLGPRLGAVEMVPILMPLEEFRDRVPAALRKVGGFLRTDEIAVQNLRDCYLQQRELTRDQYWAIVQGFVGIPLARRPKPVEILFADDPLGESRLSESGMRPRIYRSSGARWRRALATGGSHPVTGINFYQGYAVARMAGQLLFSDPTCFRLPFGVELEVAALGTKAPGVLNGVVGTKLADLRNGDRIVTPLGDAMYGLDFGVREWVLDLPWPVGDVEGSHKKIVAGYMANHTEHLVRAVRFAGMGVALRARLEPTGVVRGVTLAETAELRDLELGLPSREDQPLTRGVPGVVRSRYVRRDGTGFAGKPDRLLPRIGMRLAGGESFVKKVRTR